jgi:WD40 repeat protein
MFPRQRLLLLAAYLAAFGTDPARGQPRLDAAGDPLPEKALVRLGTTRFRQSDHAVTLAYSPDGRVLATAGGEYAPGYRGQGWASSIYGLIHLWDPTTGKELRRLEGHARLVRDIAFAPDSKRLASAGDDNVVILWDTIAGEEVSRIKPPERTSCVAFAPDGKVLATGGSNLDNAIMLWDPSTARPAGKLSAPNKGWTNALGISPDSKTLAACWHNNTVVLLLVWDIPSGRLLHKIEVKGGVPNAIWSLAFSPSGKVLAGGLADQTMRLWDTETGKLLRQIDAKSGLWQKVCFSPDGKSLASGGRGRVALWDPDTGLELRVIGDKESGANAVAFGPDGKTFAWVDRNGIRFMDLEKGEERFRNAGNTWPVETVAFAPDGKTVATGGGRLRVWDAGTGKERPLAGNVTHVGGVAFSPDGKTLLSSGQDQVIHLWDVGAGKELRRFTGECGEVEYLAFLPDGKNAVSMSQCRVYRSGTSATQKRELGVRIWDVSDGRQTKSVGNVVMSHATSSLDGRIVALGLNWIQLWDLATGSQLGKVEGDTMLIYGLALAADGRRLAASCFMHKSRGSELTLWETASGKVVIHFEERPGQGAEVISVALSAGLLASGDVFGMIRLWDLETGKELQELKGHNGAILSLAFSGDGKRLISGSCDTTALIWDVENVLPRTTTQVLKAEKLSKLWNDIAGDAPQAVRAVGQLARAPKSAVPFLRERLQADLVPEQKQIAKLIGSLDDEKFEVREKASRELAAFGKHAEPALSRALDYNPSVETRRRIQGLLPKLSQDAWPPSDVLRIIRTIEILERIGTDETRQIIERLAKASSDSWTPAEAKAALERMDRLAKTRR